MSHPQYLLRFDDICPTMDWRIWEKIEEHLVRRNVKPLLAVVPDNHDPSLQVNPPSPEFWDRVRTWQERGWTIALHGFQHRYVSRNAGIVAVRKKSEFAGLPVEEQREKLERGREIFTREGVHARVWIAPGNTFDETTVALLPSVGIRVICDGYFRFPFVCARGLTWVPQQLFGFRPAPPGVWTVCYHHNLWSAEQFRKFVASVDAYEQSISSLDQVLEPSRHPARKGSEWLCLHPRLSRLVIRLELKLWGWLGHRDRNGHTPNIDAAGATT